MHYIRAYRQDGDEEGPMVFVASTGGTKRDGKDLDPGRWMLENYQRNPVVLWSHDYMGRTLPIGRAEVEVAGGRLMARVTFDLEDEFARQVERKYRAGFLSAISVGWNDVEEDGELHYDLLDISAVPVPSDPDALLERERAGLRSLRVALDRILDIGDLGVGGEEIEEDIRILDIEERGAIPPHTTAKADEGMAWDGPGEVAKAEGRAQLRRMHAWVDGEMDPDTKQAYKLPHHLAESGQVVWRGVAAAMARLLQAATQIPGADRRGVFNHLSRHYGQFDKEAPEFRTVKELEAMGPELARGLFLEGEAEMWPELFGVDPELMALWRNIFTEEHGDAD